MIRTMRDTKNRPSTKWKRTFVWFRIVKIEDGHVKPSWGICIFDYMERRYSASQGRTMWRNPA